MKKKYHLKFSFIALFLSCMIFSIVMTSTYVRNKMQMEIAQMEQVILTSSNKIENTLTSLLYKTQVLSALVIESNGEIHNFEQVAATIIDDISIRNVLLAPNGIVTNVYPLEKNEDVIGLNYFDKGEGNIEAIIARDTGKLILGGPFKLLQGGQALVGRLPVYIKNEFWGLVSITLDYPQALVGAELEQLRTQGFAYEIWRTSPDTGKHQIIASSSYKYNHSAPYIEKNLNIFNANWNFRLSPIRNWYEYPETWFFLLIGIICSYLIALLVVHNRELESIKIDLERISNTDSLTGILNRRGIFEHLNEIFTLSPKPFVLNYIDLNKFKSVNDIYGHKTGDKMLVHFSEIIRKNLKNNDIFGRIGGDEFVVIFKDIEDMNYVKGFWEKIQNDCHKAVEVNSEESIDILFSVGLALYPSEAKTLDELICVADRNMYREKNKIK